MITALTKIHKARVQETHSKLLECWKVTSALVLMCFLLIYEVIVEIPAYCQATASWAHKRLPWNPVTNTNISPFLTQQALTPNQLSAGCLTCGQLGANTCLSLDKALWASCIINNFARLRGQELSFSQCKQSPTTLSAIHPFSTSSRATWMMLVSLTKYQFLVSALQLSWLDWEPWSLLRVEVKSSWKNCLIQYTWHLIGRKSTAG